MTDNDDEQPTGMDGEIDTTAAVPVSPQTVAAERYSEQPTTVGRVSGRLVITEPKMARSRRTVPLRASNPPVIAGLAHLHDAQSAPDPR
jgi:hypothetical protein